MAPPAGETGLILVLAGGVCLPFWQKLLGWLPLAPASLQEGPWLPRLAFACLALALPSALFLASRWVAVPLRRQRVLYGLLPLLWALLLARHLPVGMAEAGLVLPVSVSPWAWAPAAALPAWSADPHVIAFCQSAVVLLGVVAALVLQRRLRQADRWRWLLGPLLVLALGAGGRWLVALP